MDCTRYHDIDVNWRASFGAFVSLSLPIYSRYIRALSSHNSHCPEWQTLDTLDTRTRTRTRTRGLRCAILNGFIDTLRCRNNKQLSRQAGRQADCEGMGRDLHVCKHWQQQMPSNISIVAAMNPSEEPCKRICYLQLLLSVPGKMSSLLRASFANFDFNDFSARVVNLWAQIEFWLVGNISCTRRSRSKKGCPQILIDFHYLSRPTKNAASTCGCNGALFFLFFFLVVMYNIT